MIIKIAILALVCYVLYRLFMNDNKKKAEKEAQEKKKRVDSVKIDLSCFINSFTFLTSVPRIPALGQPSLSGL